MTYARPRSPSALLLALLVALAPAAASAQAHPAAPPALGQNLVRNSGCEASHDNPSDPGVPEVWQGDFRCTTYGSVGSEWDWNVPGVASGGQRYFRASVTDSTPAPKLAQSFALAGVAPAAIDSGKVRFTLAAHLGTFPGDAQPTFTMTAHFLDAAGHEVAVSGNAAALDLSTVTLPQPTVGGASMGPATISGTVPAGARRVEIRFAAGPTPGHSPPETSPAFADNVSFVLSRAP
jgi:hypothetical protein